MRKAEELANRLTSENTGPWDNLDAAAELRRLAQVERELESIMAACEKWVHANARGGWIDDLRNSNEARHIELEALKAAMGEPVAWLVYAGIGDMRPIYPAMNTRDLAEMAASSIKSSVEVRPLYAIKETK